MIRTLANFQHFMLDDPDLVSSVNRILHNADPRWLQIPDEKSYVGGLFFAYMMSSPIPGA